MALFLALVLCLAASIASADVFFAPSDSKIPFTTFEQLQEVCTAARAGSTPVAMYTQGMTTLVDTLMAEKKVTVAYVSAYLNADTMWIWSIYQGGKVMTTLVNSDQWASGNPTEPQNGSRYAAYSSKDKGLISTTGSNNYPVACEYENTTSITSKKFPWWAILIAAVGVVAVVAVAAFCLCCRKKRHNDEDDEDGELTTRNSSLSCGTSDKDSDQSENSWVCTSSRSSFTGEATSVDDASSAS
ncbi:hypothetical protein LtaPh_0403700 [Leishmania tarentolae]|uniref:C-type lectin domain-containing protein n=1 Tax=Leishmania tarentolae TaxID=5689 RepID=A0A640K7V3_LEITA|nr:hypothetical protein LtaPh_0403700 [Leishmania tarentolae]